MQFVSASPAPSTPVPAGSQYTGGTIQYRRNYLLGLWAAHELRMEGREAQLYAAELADFGETSANDDAVVNVVRADIAAYDGDIGAPIIWRRLKGFQETVARESVAPGYGSSVPQAA